MCHIGLWRGGCLRPPSNPSAAQASTGRRLLSRQRDLTDAARGELDTRRIGRCCGAAGPARHDRTGRARRERPGVTAAGELAAFVGSPTPIQPFPKAQRAPRLDCNLTTEPSRAIRAARPAGAVADGIAAAHHAHGRGRPSGRRSRPDDRPPAAIQAGTAGNTPAIEGTRGTRPARPESLKESRRERRLNMPARTRPIIQAIFADSDPSVRQPFAPPEPPRAPHVRPPRRNARQRYELDDRTVYSRFNDTIIVALTHRIN